MNPSLERLRKTRWRAAAIAGVVALTAAACSSNSAPSGNTTQSGTLGSKNVATGSTITVGFISDGQSQAVDNSSEIPAAQAAVSYINNYLGGIGGHVLQLKVCTDNQTPSGATDCDNQMISAHVPAVLYDVSGQGGTIFKGLQSTDIPLFVYGGIDQDTLLSKTAFVLTNGLGTLAGPPALLQQAGGKRGAVIVINLPAATGPVQQIGGLFYKNAGATLDVVPVGAGVADMTPQVQAELNKNPDQVSIIGNDTFCISAVKALRTLGYSKQIVVIPTCISDASKKALGSSLNGIVDMTSASTDKSSHELLYTTR